MSNIATNSSKEWAIAYSTMGFKVFPVWGVTGAVCHCGLKSCVGNSRGKHPIVDGWQEWAEFHTGDLLSTAWQWPNENIGIVTGKVSGIFVVDIDTKYDGMSNFKKWESENGELKTDYRVLTGSGGYHLYLKYPQSDIKLGNKTSVLGTQSGVDFRGDGGYVVAPPSKHFSGGEYIWEV